MYFLNIFISFINIMKHFRTSYLQNEAVNELKVNFISREATHVSLIKHCLAIRDTFKVFTPITVDNCITKDMKVFTI